MAMTTAQGGAAIEEALENDLADFAKKRASQTQLSIDEANAVNVDLVTKLKASLLTALDSAWSD